MASDYIKGFLKGICEGVGELTGVPGCTRTITNALETYR